MYLLLHTSDLFIKVEYLSKLIDVYVDKLAIVSSLCTHYPVCTQDNGYLQGLLQIYSRQQFTCMQMVNSTKDQKDSVQVLFFSLCIYSAMCACFTLSYVILSPVLRPLKHSAVQYITEGDYVTSPCWSMSPSLDSQCSLKRAFVMNSKLFSFS